MAFSGENILASGSYDKTIKIWNIDSGKSIRTLRGHTHWVQSITFSSDGQTLVSGSLDKTIKIWNVNTGDCLNTLKEHTGYVRAVACSSQRNILVSSAIDQAIKIWDINTGECIKTLQGYSNCIWSVSFSSNDKIIAGGSSDKLVRLWNVEDGNLIRSLSGHSEWVTSIDFSPNQNILASGSMDQNIILWDITTGRSLHYLYENNTQGIWSVAFSRDGRTLIAGSEDSMIRLWDVSQDYRCLDRVSGHTKWVSSVIFFYQNDNLLGIFSGSGDDTARKWNFQQQDHTKLEEIILFASNTESIDPNSQSEPKQVYSVSVSADGNVLATGNSDNTIKLWNIPTDEQSSLENIPQLLRILEGHQQLVWSVSFHPTENNILASGSGDSTIKIWDIETGECIKTLVGHTQDQGVHSVKFSHDGSILASGSEDQTIKIWDVQTGECIRTLRDNGPYKGMNVTGVTGITDVQKETLVMLGAVENE